MPPPPNFLPPPRLPTPLHPPLLLWRSSCRLSIYYNAKKATQQQPTHVHTRTHTRRPTATTNLQDLQGAGWGRAGKLVRASDASPSELYLYFFGHSKTKEKIPPPPNKKLKDSHLYFPPPLSPTHTQTSVRLSAKESERTKYKYYKRKKKTQQVANRDEKCNHPHLPTPPHSNNPVHNFPKPLKPS